MFSFLLLSAVCAQQATPEGRALAFLAREVPGWAADNKCYSCHNNGDAARALYTASRLKTAVPEKALEDTSRWLARPQQWDHNGGEKYSDKGLARIQFAGALVDALDAGLLKDRDVLLRAAELVAQGQDKAGSWQADNGEPLGSPTTYGPRLATYQARRILEKADPRKYQDSIARANDWLLKAPVKNVLDAATSLLALDTQDTPEAGRQREGCVAMLRKAQAKDGGWGPYVNSPPENFDTALVVLALARWGPQEEIKAMRQRGRDYLIAAQQKDGSWQETTRPTGAVSYAQRLSTTGWATLALLATRSKIE